MEMGEILFVGGNVERLASIKIRCRAIAERLGIQCFYNARSVSDVPSGYKVYVCVKPDFGPEGVSDLAQKGAVVWDVIDNNPPNAGITKYICSTREAARHFIDLGETHVIPHHHCNIERVSTMGGSKDVAYLGSAHWYPSLPLVRHNAVIVDGWSRSEVATAYRQIGLSLNLRNNSEVYNHFLRSQSDVPPILDLHLKLNSGIKLINCIGFGIPSISAAEPAFFEIASHCTLFSDLENYSENVLRLQEDHDLYQTMRRNCLEIAETYHIDQIAAQYESMFKAL